MQTEEEQARDNEGKNLLWNGNLITGTVIFVTKFFSKAAFFLFVCLFLSFKIQIHTQTMETVSITEKHFCDDVLGANG